MKSQILKKRKLSKLGMGGPGRLVSIEVVLAEKVQRESDGCWYLM